MKVVYFGTDVFLSCFEYFAKNHQILALYTYHNDEDYFTEYNIVKQAEALKIPIYYHDITPEEIRRYFTEDGCEFFFVAEYDRIITIPEDIPEFRGTNIHSSLLPHGRSYYPIEAAMQRELSVTGVTLHKLVNKLDLGDIIDQRSMEIEPETDSIDIYLRLGAYALEMTGNLMKNFDECWLNAKPQSKGYPYWKRPDSELLTLHHELSIADAFDIFRKYNSMTQLELNGIWYFVTSMMSGSELLSHDTWQLSPTLLLYRIKDGHLRLQIQPKETQA